MLETTCNALYALNTKVCRGNIYENTQTIPDELKISALKKEKLKIKDLIQQLE